MSMAANAFVISPSSIAPLFAERFGIPKTAVGDVVSAPLVGMILTQIPGGYLLDRFDNRWVLTPCVVLFALTVAVIQVVDAYTVFLGLRVFAGVLTGLMFTAGANVVGEVFPPGQRGFATGAFVTSAPIAFVVAHTTSPVLGNASGAVSIFVLHAGFAVLGLALLWLGAPAVIRSAGTPSIDEFASALKNRRVLLVSTSAFAGYALYFFLNTWIPTYGTDVLQLDLSAAGFITAIVPLVGIPARVMGGWVSNYIGRRRRPVLGGALVAGLALMLVISVVDNLLFFAILLGAGGFALQLGTGVYYVFTRELAAAGTEGTSLTVMTTIGFAGSFIAPLLGGWAIGTFSWPVAFGVFAALGIAGIAVLIPVPENP